MAASRLSHARSRPRRLSRSPSPPAPAQAPVSRSPRPLRPSTTAPRPLMSSGCSATSPATMRSPPLSAPDRNARLRRRRARDSRQSAVSFSPGVSSSRPAPDAISPGSSPTGSMPTRACPTSPSTASFPTPHRPATGSSPSTSPTPAMPPPKSPSPSAPRQITTSPSGFLFPPAAPRQRLVVMGKPTQVQVNDGTVPETQASVHVTASISSRRTSPSNNRCERFFLHRRPQPRPSRNSAMHSALHPKF